MTNSEFNPGFRGIVVLLVRQFRGVPAIWVPNREAVAARIKVQACPLRAALKKQTPAPIRRRCDVSILTLRALEIGRGRLAAAAVRLDVEAQLLTFDERAHAGAFDGGHMDEHVRAAAILRDEAVAFLGVEELDGTLSHDGLLEVAKHVCGRANHSHGLQSGFRVVLSKAGIRAPARTSKAG